MIRTLSDSDFKEQVRENLDPIIIMFTGSWCAPCKQMKPTYEELSGQLTDIRFAEMDIETCPDTTSELAIRSVPSLALFADGMIREIHAGTMSKTELRTWIHENI